MSTKKKKPDVNVSVAGQDCSADSDWSPKELRDVAAIFLRAADAVENREHGCVENDVAHVGVDFGLGFDEETGLPPLPAKTRWQQPTAPTPEKERGKP